MILLAYDSSEDARHAVVTAGTLVSGRAVVLHVRSIESSGLAGSMASAAPMAAPTIAEDQEERQEQAKKIVDEGCRLAREAGFEPEAEILPGAGVHGIQEAILQAADDRDASLIVVGRRGMGPLKSALLGSVSTAVVKHATRPVLVVPSAE